ncbi:MAG: hypothetical protein PHY16_15795 [Methylobacter sp.]|nr:hypothetical protein [Methylobacter sp.]
MNKNILKSEVNPTDNGIHPSDKAKEKNIPAMNEAETVLAELSCEVDTSSGIPIIICDNGVA